MLDAIMVSLRTSDGLALEPFRQEYGRSALKAMLPALEHHCQAGLAMWVDRLGRPASGMTTAAAVRLTDPGGWLVSNTVISDILAAL